MTSTTDTDGTRPRPHLTLELREDGAGVLNGRVVVPAAAGNVRALLLRIIGEVATATATPLLIQARDPQGTWDLTAWPNGAVTDQHTDVPAAGRWYVAAHDPATAPADAAPAVAAPAAPTGLATPPSPPVLAAAVPGHTRTAPAPTAPAPARPTAPQPAAPLTPEPTAPAAPEPTAPAAPEPTSTSSTSISPALSPWVRRPAPVTDPDPTTVSEGLVHQSPQILTRAAPLDDVVTPAAVPAAAGSPGLPHRRPSGSAAWPRRIVPSMLMGLAGTLVVAALVVIAHPGDGASPQRSVHRSPTATSGPDGGAQAGAEASAPALSVAPLAAAPPGFSTTPQWAAATAKWSRIAVDASGVIVTRDPTGRVQLLDPTTGAVTWSSPQTYDAGWDGPRLATLDGRPAAVLTSATQLISWALPEGTTPAGQAQTIAVPAGARLVWSGGAPLATTSTSCAILRGGAWQQIALPAGYRPAAAGDGVVLAVNPATGTWLRLTPTGAATPRRITPPPGATLPLVRAEAAGTDYLLTVWTTRTAANAGAKTTAKAGQAVALVDTRTGQTLSQGQLAAGVDLTKAPVTRQGETTVLGSVVVNRWINRLQQIGNGYSVLGMVPGTTGHLYARNATGTFDIQLQDGKAPTLPVPTDAPIPFAGYTRDGEPYVTVVVSSGADSALLSLPAS